MVMRTVYGVCVCVWLDWSRLRLAVLQTLFNDIKIFIFMHIINISLHFASKIKRNPTIRKQMYAIPNDFAIQLFFQYILAPFFNKYLVNLILECAMNFPKFVWTIFWLNSFLEKFLLIVHFFPILPQKVQIFTAANYYDS